MSKTVNRLVSLMLTLLFILSSAVVPAYAAPVDDHVAVPLYEAPIRVSGNATASISLLLSATAQYTAVDSQVTRVKITTYVEKRSLLVIWNRVDIGQTNDEWVDNRYSSHGSVSHSVQLPSSGTYRVTAVFEVYNGSTLLDTIEWTSDKITC